MQEKQPRLTKFQASSTRGATAFLLRGFDRVRSMLRDDGSYQYPHFLYFPPHG